MVCDVSGDDFDALILPGGTINPDGLRVNPDAVGFVRESVGSGNPVGSLCHGPWTLVEANVLRGPDTDVVPQYPHDRNAGGNVVDQEVVTDQGLVTSPRASGSLSVNTCVADQPSWHNSKPESSSLLSHIHPIFGDYYGDPCSRQAPSAGCATPEWHWG